MREFTLEQLKEELKREHYSQNIFYEGDDSEWTASCPCADGRIKVDGKVIRLWSRCWRVSKSVQDLIVGGTKDMKLRNKVAELIKENLDKQEWYNRYTIYMEEDYK